MTSPHLRITMEPDKRDGKPCIRGMRITVNDVLGWLAHGMTEEEILDEHPGLEKEDFAAVYAFRGRCGGSRLRSPLASADSSRPESLSQADSSTGRRAAWTRER